jgi:hypothetical protein
LVAGHGNGIGIFLNGTIHYFLHTAVVAEVNYFGATGLHYTAHDINGRIVAIEQGSGCYNTNFVLGLIQHNEVFCIAFGQ